MMDSFEKQIEEHRPMMIGYASVLLKGDIHRAEDLVQEACLTAYNKQALFDETRSFPKWLRGIVRYKALEAHRAEQRYPWVMDPQVIEGMEEVYQQFDQQRQEENWKRRISTVGKCIKELHAHLRQAVELVYHGGLSFRDAGEKMGLNETTVSQRVYRARKLIRTCILTRYK